ncbi:SPOSA6832_04486 [Sporobolomyces salmonicolor]|uniref:SPOSA6832_04486-mRNA-1:cds n=1 Tax=Sporidiobolus salmonicolor TaxID=5005 RepID=A0A0D6ESR6_SPOSA|nr:SPOSA6832_04486 [Sporobolomyces salmonicolor]
MPRPPTRPLWLALLVLVGLVAHSTAYQVLISDQDDVSLAFLHPQLHIRKPELTSSNSFQVRQVCSGMWGKGKENAFIEGALRSESTLFRRAQLIRVVWSAVLFSPASRGQLALVVFEWEDAKYLGVETSGNDAENAWQEDRVYICTLSAQQAGLCDESQLGRFISTAPAFSNSSIWTASVRFDAVPSTPINEADLQLGTGPYRYEVTKTGYYCVGAVPVVLEGARVNSSYTGVVDFENVYGGLLPASEYPKVLFYFILFLVYLALGLVWAVLCWLHRREILPLQQYISATVAFLIVEQLLVWRYWAYLNNVGHPGVAGAFLVLVSVLNAARNSLSLYLLCLASMGLSIIRPSLGSVMGRVRLLAICHFVFGVLYSLGTVAIPLESAGFFIFFFVLPLAFSLTAFLTWIMYSLGSTIADLGARRQTYKKTSVSPSASPHVSLKKLTSRLSTVFVRLYRILICASIVILAFFVLSTLSFSSRLDPSFPARTWKTRWLLLNGWLALLYALVFFSIAFLWRPTGHNRLLALSHELAQTEDEADLYDVDAMVPEDEREDAGELKDAFPLKSVRRDGEEDVVFEVGSDDDEESAVEGRKDSARPRRSDSGGDEDERQRLRFSEEDDDDLDITTQHGQESAGLDAPPEYRSYKND